MALYVLFQQTGFDLLLVTDSHLSNIYVSFIKYLQETKLHFNDLCEEMKNGPTVTLDEQRKLLINNLSVIFTKRQSKRMGGSVAICLPQCAAAPEGRTH